MRLYSCTQCHGPEANGQVGPGLVDANFQYPKNATNKGMFETISQAVPNKGATGRKRLTWHNQSNRSYRMASDTDNV